jgi:hypothetical protein
LAEYLKLSIESLILTIFIEVIIALLFGLRGKTELGTVILINVITNPLLNYLVAVNSYFHLISQSGVLILFLEVVVVIAEWRLLLYVLRTGVKKMLVLSIVMNACSYIAGLFIFPI